MSESSRDIEFSFEEQLQANSIPLSLNPLSKPITCSSLCGHCKGIKPGCKNPPGDREQQQYISCLEDFNFRCNHHKLKNFSILYSLKLCGILSRMHWSVFLPTGYRLSQTKNLELRKILQFRRSYTDVPNELLYCARQVDPINLSRQQWKVLLPNLQDHFPSVPRKFYLLLIKLSLGLGFLIKRICLEKMHLCPLIFRRVFTSRLVRSKDAPALKFYYWEKPERKPYLLDIFFPNPNSS